MAHNVEILANFIDNNRDIASVINDKLVQQRNYLNRDTHGIYDFNQAIREITNKNILDMLIEKSCKIKNEIEDEEYWKMSARNISAIKNKTAHNVREMELLNTLHKIRVECICGCDTFSQFECQYVLNGLNFSEIFNIPYYSINKNNTNAYVTVGGSNNDNINEICAFQSAMTLHEYTTFINRVPLVMLQSRLHLVRDTYTPHYPPTVNIANLLLCAMNEQEQNDVTLTVATMSCVKLVLYDEFLLKCITMK